MNESAFAQLLRRFRRQSGLTLVQTQVALEDLNYTIDTSSLSKYESGERRPSTEFIPFIIRALGLSQDDEHALLAAYIEDLRLEALNNYLEGKSRVT